MTKKNRILWEVDEQEDETSPPQQPQQPVQTQPPQQPDSSGADAYDPNAEQGGDTYGDPNADPNAMGAEPVEDPAVRIQKIGRIFELKKIFTRLITVQNYLMEFSDDKFDEMKTSVDEALELFHIVSININTYSEELDEIIVNYYKFLTDVVKKLESLA